MSAAASSSAAAAATAASTSAAPASSRKRTLSDAELTESADDSDALTALRLEFEQDVADLPWNDTATDEEREAMFCLYRTTNPAARYVMLTDTLGRHDSINVRLRTAYLKARDMIATYHKLKRQSEGKNEKEAPPSLYTDGADQAMRLAAKKMDAYTEDCEDSDDDNYEQSRNNRYDDDEDEDEDDDVNDDDDEELDEDDLKLISGAGASASASAAAAARPRSNQDDDDEDDDEDEKPTRMRMDE
jgi:hypothetical protein